MPKDKSENKKIIAAARREFTEQGFENASMRRIASESGITVGQNGGFFLSDYLLRLVQTSKSKNA